MTTNITFVYKGFTETRTGTNVTERQLKDLLDNPSFTHLGIRDTNDVNRVEFVNIRLPLAIRIEPCE